jgi:hypothetical protein
MSDLQGCDTSIAEGFILTATAAVVAVIRLVSHMMKATPSKPSRGLRLKAAVRIRDTGLTTQNSDTAPKVAPIKQTKLLPNVTIPVAAF